MENNSVQQWMVYDMKTGQQCGQFSDRMRARRKADRLDMAYGGVRFQVRAIEGHGKWVPVARNTEA